MSNKYQLTRCLLVVVAIVDFPAPCVTLQGGSYIFGKLQSSPVPLVRSTK